MEKFTVPQQNVTKEKVAVIVKKRKFYSVHNEQRKVTAQTPKLFLYMQKII